MNHIYGEIKRLEARIELLERKLEKVCEKTGVSSGELNELELNALIDYAHRTMNYKPLKEYLRKTIGQRAKK